MWFRKKQRLMPRMSEWEAILTVVGRNHFHKYLVPRNDMRRWM